MRRFVLVAAAIGLAVAVMTVIHDDRSRPAAQPVGQSPVVPFASYVSGAGIVEASTGNIAIGTSVAGIVTAIDVELGQRVAAGAPLFHIDDRDVEAALLPLQARVGEAKAALAKTKNLVRIGAELRVGHSISAVELENRRYDLAIKQAALASAQAQVKQLRMEIERRVVRAPVAGRILRINIHPGEFAESGATTPLVLLGDDRRLHLRVNVDEYDAWRVRPDAPALAFVRGNPALKTRLTFEHFEPYVVPKVSLTGQSTERTDTRVLQVIYSFAPAGLPVYVGQEMDAFIQAPAAGDNGAPAPAGRAP